MSFKGILPPLCLSALLGLAACASSIEVTSNPAGADVIAKPLGSGAEKKLGQTPLTLNTADLEGVPTGSGPLLLKITKDGYKPMDLLVTEMGSGTLKVSAELEPGPGFENPSQLNAHLEAIFTAQQFIKMRKYDEAQKLLEAIRAKVPTLAVVHELLGGVYFLKGDKVQALDAFKRALALNPNSVDALNMSDEISRSTASVGATSAAGAATTAAPAAAAPTGGAQ
ncbi:MAG: tetratricopeptide repeat protein [Bdellovibrionota bacterium]